MVRPLALLVLAVSSCVQAAERPNIVLIVADDLGYGDLGCYGSKINQTPNIDTLAKRGVRFTDFHSAGSMCTPTRAAMLTGQYQQRFGRKFDGPLSGERHRHTGLPHEAVTIADVLGEAGYATACFGKWHLGYQPPWLPPNQGFDEFRGLGSGDGDHHSHIDRSGNEDWWHNNELKMEKGYTADLLTKHSIEFIEKHRDRPFFLYVPHLAIHFPWQGPHDPPHRVKGRNYNNDKWGIISDRNNVSAHVKAMVESVDQSTGEILNALKRLALEKRTVVIFTSDNGGYLNYGANFRNISSNGELRGQKGTLYEGGHRVPMIVSMPEIIPPAETHETGHSTDLIPTICALADAKTNQLPFDGIDLSPVLLRGEPISTRMLFWRAGDELAVRSGRWKLFMHGEKRELYDLTDDVAEQNNLATRHSDLFDQLYDAWKTWETDVNRTAATFEEATD